MFAHTIDLTIRDTEALLALPERRYEPRFGMYGADLIAANYAGLSVPPFEFEGEWQHGWIGKEGNFDPEFVVRGDGASRFRKQCRYLVARDDQAEYLRSQGYLDVHAIGLPIVYLPSPKVTRRNNSLLVMPAHSLPETREVWNSDEYADYIYSIAKHFSEVVVCVHPSCAKKGNWIHAFSNYGFKIVLGAELFDSNSLFRMRDLFAQFEFVTGNKFGSFVAYASYYGCKVSIAGPHPSFRKEDYAEHIFFKQAPHLLEDFDNLYKDKVLERLYSQFVVDPWKATRQVEWAEIELGLKFKRRPRQIKQLFRWDASSRFKRRIHRALGKLTSHA